MQAQYGPTEFLPMTFYYSAPYSLPQGNARGTWYGINGTTPSVMFDGTILESGGLTSGSMFSYYDYDYGIRSSVVSPLIINGAYTVLNGQVNASFTIQVDEAVTGSNTVHVFVCQDDLHGQPNMVVDILDTEPFTLDTPGQTTVVGQTFAMDPSWNENDLRIIALVQNNSTKEVLQAAQATPDYACTVVADCVPDGVNAGWRLQGPSGLDMTGQGDLTLNLFEAGQFTLTWDDVPWWTTPTDNPQVQTVAEDGTITFTGSYTDGPFVADTALPLGDPGSGCGVSLVDVDEDGDLDIHVVNKGSADQLLSNDGTGAFTDIATGPLADSGMGHSSAWADFNGDGHLDVYLVKDNQANVLLNGDGNGNFAVNGSIGVGITGPCYGAAWLDFEHDGDLDLYIVQRGAENTLLRNYGDIGSGAMFFSPVVGGPTSNSGNGTAICMTDGDLDGGQDIYVTNQFSANLLLKEVGAGFDDVSTSSGLGDVGNSTGAAWGDYDNDGDFDLYIANEGNADKLYRCSSNFHYSLQPGPGLSDTGNGRGVAWVDLNNDGWLDLYVVRYDQSDLVLINDQTGGFFKVPVGTAAAEGPGNAVVCGDLDGDHRMDVFVSRQGAANVLLHNTHPTQNHWVDIDLVAAGSNTSALSAKISLVAGGFTQTRLITSGTGYMCNAPLRQHFGIGSATIVDLVTITWPNGETQSFGGFSPDITLKVIQGEYPLSGVTETLPVATRLDPAYPNPFNPTTTIAYDLASSGPVKLEVFTLDGRKVATLADTQQQAGHHQVIWRGTDDFGRTVASGSYLYRLQSAGGASQTGRMTLVK